MLTILTIAAFLNFVNGWHAITVDDAAATLYLRSSIVGPPDTRYITAMMIKPSDAGTISSIRFTLEINCANKSARYTEYTAFVRPHVRLPNMKAPSIAPMKIQPETFASYLWTAACTPDPDEMGHFSPIMLDPYVFADQAFRIRRLGVANEFAIALAALDPKISPETYEQSLNAMVPIAKQVFVRAIKEVPTETGK